MSDAALAALIDRAHARRARLHTDDVRDLPDIAELSELTITGQQSQFGLKSQVRRVLIPGSIRLDGCIETPSAVARDYLRWKYGGSPPAKAGQLARLQEDGYRVPGFALPTRFERGYYIDIKSTYFSIMQVMGWNVDYWPERWLMRAVPPADFPYPEHKRARSCLVSCAIGTQVPAWNPDVKRPWGDPAAPLTVQNPIQNLQLWRLIQDVLMCIGWEWMAAGAVYVNTDGCIVTSEAAKQAVEQIVTDWGLQSRVKARGAGRVVTHGVYSVGREKHIPEGCTYAEQASAHLHRVPYDGWLQQRFARWAAYAGRVLESEDDHGVPG